MGSSKYQISALIKAHDILEFLAQVGEATFTEIHTTLDHPKSSIYKTISTLKTLGYIRSVAGGAKYSLGLKLLELGSQAAAHVDLFTEARPLVKKLSMDTKRTCHIGILESSDVVYVVKENTHCLFRIDTWVGKRIPIYCTAMGKVLLAWKDEKEIDKLLKEVSFERVAPNTITDIHSFKKGLPEVVERGWAIDDEESARLIRCVSAPIINQENEVCAALSVSTLAELDNYEEMLAITSKVVECARSISGRLGAALPQAQYVV